MAVDRDIKVLTAKRRHDNGTTVVRPHHEMTARQQEWTPTALGSTERQHDDSTTARQPFALVTMHVPRLFAGRLVVLL